MIYIDGQPDNDSQTVHFGAYELVDLSGFESHARELLQRAEGSTVVKRVSVDLEVDGMRASLVVDDDETSVRSWA